MKPQQFILFLSIFIGQACYAQLIVNTAIITFDDPTVTREDVTVINDSDEDTMYLQVEPFKVMNPGTQEQKLIPIDLSQEPEFLVTPNKLIVPPKGRSIVRFLNLKVDNQQENIYRVNITPIKAPQELSTVQSAELTSRLNVVIAYQVLVIDLPKKPHSTLELERHGSIATFSNSGNSNYLLSGGTQCNPADPEVCLTLEDRRIYSRNEWILELPFDGPFTYTVKDTKGNSTQFFK